MSNEQGNIPVMPKKVSNRDLLKILMRDGGYPTYNGTRSVEELKCILEEVMEFLDRIKPLEGMNREEDKTRMLNSFLQQNEIDFRPLSMIQINASLKMQEHLLEEEYNKALFEFANCIEDDGKGLDMKKFISLNEYALYANLVKGFYGRLARIK